MADDWTIRKSQNDVSILSFSEMHNEKDIQKLKNELLAMQIKPNTEFSKQSVHFNQ